MNAEELRHALLAETEPAPGLAARAFTDFPPPERHRRRALTLAAVALALCMVAALVVAGGRLGSRSRPATPPSPTGIPGAPDSSIPVTVMTITPSGAIWIARQAGPKVQRTFFYESVDGGRHWVRRLTASGSSVSAFPRMRMDRDGRGLLIGQNGQEGLYETADGGAHWAWEPLPASLGRGPTVQLLNGHEAMVLGDVGDPARALVVISHTADGGRSWTSLAPIDPIQVFNVPELCVAAKGCELGSFPATFVDARHGIGIGDPRKPGSGLFATSDGGRTWQPAVVPAGLDLTNGTDMTAGADGRDLALVTYGAAGRKVYVSDDGGRSWSSGRPIPPPVGVLSPGQLTIVDHTHWYAGTSTGVFSTSDQGLHWHPAAPIPGRLTRIETMGFTDARHGWVVVDNGGILSASQPRPAAVPQRYAVFATDDGGRTWRQVPLP
jgi:photosystem II stability/assembly factor-like uncharacterized protein